MLYISNKGLVETGALTLLGASVKDAAQIGKFGSGFKYALATLLRNNIEFRVWSGTREIKITTRVETFRDKQFDIIYVDGERTSITTATGPEWKVSDAIREIWSNAVDEGEARHASYIAPMHGYTTLAIGDHFEIEAMIRDWEMYFVYGVTALHSNDHGRILRQQVPNYFRRGVWICEDREKTGIFSYDFVNIELPESRKIKSSSTTLAVYYTLAECNEPEVWKAILDCHNEDRMEWSALSYYNMGSYYPGYTTLHEVFNQRFNYIGHEKNRDRLASSVAGLKIYWCSGKIYRALDQMQIPSIERKTDFNSAFTIVPWPIGYEAKARAAVAALASFGIDYSKFAIKFAQYENEGEKPPLAIALRSSKTCVLFDGAFTAHPDMLTKAFVEEWTHLQHDVTDGSVQQQHVYLDLIVQLIKKVR